MSDWLDDVKTDASAMSVINAMLADYRKRMFEAQQAEEHLKYANQQLQEATQKLTETLRKNGLESVRMEDGVQIEVVENVKCSVKKDDASKKQVADWLREVGADDLVTATLTVMPSAKAKLDELGIGYDEDVKMNTNSIKAWVKSEMQVGNITIDDIPKGLSWYQYDDIKVKA